MAFVCSSKAGCLSPSARCATPLQSRIVQVCCSIFYYCPSRIAASGVIPHEASPPVRTLRFPFPTRFSWLWQQWKSPAHDKCSCHHLGRCGLRSINNHHECDFAMHSNSCGNWKLQFDREVVDEQWKRKLERASDCSLIGRQRYGISDQHAGHNQIWRRIRCSGGGQFSHNYVGIRCLRAIDDCHECNFAMHSNGTGNGKLQLGGNLDFEPRINQRDRSIDRTGRARQCDSYCRQCAGSSSVRRNNSNGAVVDSPEQTCRRGDGRKQQLFNRRRK